MNFCFLLSLDFDGTLYEEEPPHVDPGFHGELDRLRKAGAAWVVNTGRSLPHTLEGLAQARFEHAPDFLVTREREIHVRNAVGRWVDFGPWNGRCGDEHRRLLRAARPLLRRVKKWLAEETMASYLEIPDEPAGIVTTHPEEMAKVCAYLDPLLGEVPHLRYERNHIWLRFGHAGFTKGTALAHLAGELGLAPRAVFAAGDNFNDLSMLDPRVAAHLACPANALAVVKDVVERHGGYCAAGRTSLGMAEAMARLHRGGTWVGSGA